MNTEAVIKEAVKSDIVRMLGSPKGVEPPLYTGLSSTNTLNSETILSSYIVQITDQNLKSIQDILTASITSEREYSLSEWCIFNISFVRVVTVKYSSVFVCECCCEYIFSFSYGTLFH